MASTIDELVNTLDAIDVTSFADDASKRNSIRAAADRLLARVETPYERAWRLMWQYPMAMGTVQTVLNLGIAEKWNQAGGSQKTLDELHAYANTDVDINVLRECLSKLQRDICHGSCLNRSSAALVGIIPYPGRSCGRHLQAHTVLHRSGR